MCTGIEIAAMAAAAAGTATEAYAQHQALKAQDNIAAEGILTQSKLQKQGETDVSNLTGSLAKSNADTIAKSAGQLKAYQDALAQSSSINQSADPNVPGASKAYKAAQSTAASGAGSYISGIANSAATTQGTDLERIDENQKIGDTAGKLGLLNTQSNEQNYLTKLKIQATQPNPWLVGLGEVLKGASVAMSFGAGAGALGATSAVGAPATGIAAGAASGSEGLATGATAAGGNIFGQTASTAAAST